MLQKRLHMRSSSTHLAPLGLVAVGLARLGRVLHVLKRPLGRRLHVDSGRSLSTLVAPAPAQLASGGRRQSGGEGRSTALVAQAARISAPS